ncbi:MAG: GNAT family N-acetyltransferase [Planctomycetes bacterium]|nr:GNAT family N-acetyltransferase [Planctomycetota bacterium]
MEQIREIQSQDDIRRCYDVMHELRTHLSMDEFVSQVGRQVDRQGYKLACLEDAGDVAAVAGFRFIEMLAWGRAMYVDDLVTAARARSKGYGGRLFDWLVELAKKEGCAQFHLDSGVQRHGAHRFYLQKRMDITSYHFVMNLTD